MMASPEKMPFPPTLAVVESNDDNDAQTLRFLSRSPHPYRRLNDELLQPSDRVVAYNGNSSGMAPYAQGRRRLAGAAARDGQSAHAAGAPPLLSPGMSFSKESSFGSDSGTEADDESVLKTLPAPKTTRSSHKGLRGGNDTLSGTSSPLFPPATPVSEQQVAELGAKLESTQAEWRLSADRVKRNRNLVRRAVEVAILTILGVAVTTKKEVQPFLKLWLREMEASFFLLVVLLFLYPLRVLLWSYRRKEGQGWSRLKWPADFDPAPVLYPHTITMLTTLLLAPSNPAIMLPNLVLSISSLPEEIIPGALAPEAFNSMHWLFSCLPLALAAAEGKLHTDKGNATLASSRFVSSGTALFLFPLHRTLGKVLNYLTSTSLLPAELQLLSTALVDILLLSRSPQMRILKALLWGGCLGVVVSCGPVIPLGIALARVPKWRFKRPSARSSYPAGLKRPPFFSWARLKQELSRAVPTKGQAFDGGFTSEEEVDDVLPASPLVNIAPTDQNGSAAEGTVPLTPLEDSKAAWAPAGLPVIRRHTLPVMLNQLSTHTLGGRRKRATSKTVRAFFKLTEAEADRRKWRYAAWVYGCILVVVFGVIRHYISKYALGGHEAIGWALGYLFGDINWFRFQVTKENLNWWIPLPRRYDATDEDTAAAVCQQGWVQRIRRAELGAANTRLILGSYWLGVLLLGLVVVLRLKDVYEVDTRRKVFHFMMVAMFLPATYVDPAFAGLALAIVLAAFLLLDLLRASQLPPLSRPITHFLAPYVDGRDFQGPVVISHIFLLIGCAIPLWLTLGSLPRSPPASNHYHSSSSFSAGGGVGDDDGGDGKAEPWSGWEVPTREVSMVSGVICVGLGDAAASLIGRRWGRRKWLWKGGKSLEGSLAFALAVLAGLAAASFWLRLGGWVVSSPQQHRHAGAVFSWPVLWWLGKAGACASLSSLTEAVLTGGNDNVIVPVVLWTCVKTLGV